MAFNADHLPASGPRLGYVLPGPILRSGGLVAMEARGFWGLDEMARRWPGPLVVLAPAVNDIPEPLPPAYVTAEIGALGFEVVEAQPIPAEIDALGLDLTLGLLAPHWEAITEARTPAVLTAEVDYGIRLGIHRATSSGIPLVRAAIGLLRVEAGLRRQARKARSIQCNGPAAFRAYGKHSATSLAFMDHRVRGADVAAAAEVPAWNGEGPLRMAFSGRLDAIKGPEYALEVAHRARRLGLPVEMSFFGGGPLERRLKDGAESWVQFRGFRDFRSEWLTDVRYEVDLMLLPHRQGDPSCTYFESLGSGAPVLGFENATLSPLVERHGVGWAAPSQNVDAMVKKVQSIFEDPNTLVETRRAGLDLVAENDFETTTQRRVDHLVRALDGCASHGPLF